LDCKGDGCCKGEKGKVFAIEERKGAIGGKAVLA
jgi:hypothetical protein